jgi:hypothetical protein
MDTYVSENLDALKTPPSNQIIQNTSNATTTNTAWEAIGAGTPVYSLAITTAGGAVLVGFHGNFRHSAANGRVYLDIYVDGVAHGGDDGIVGENCNTTNVPGVSVAFTRRITGLTAGAHTFILYWKIVTAGTVTHFCGAGTGDADLHPEFWVAEMT